MSHSIRLRRVLAVAPSALVALGLAAGCRSAEKVPALREYVQEPVLDDAARFHATYAALARRDGVGAEELALQLLLPGASFEGALDGSAGTGIAELEERFVGVAPSHLQRRATEAGADAGGAAGGEFADRGPVTFIVVPGIFSEYVDAYPFDALFRSPSSFGAHEALLATERTSAYSVRDLARIEAPLGDYIRLASLDTDDGAPLVQLVLAVPVRGSLETIGAHDDAADHVLARLDATFAALDAGAAAPDTSRLYVLGYSRGGPLGLEILRRALSEDGHPWAERLDGFVSLAGVLWGSGLADAAFEDRDSSSFRSLRALSELADDLKLDAPGDRSSDLTRKQFDNTLRWGKALLELAAAPQPPPVRLEREDSPLGIPELGHLARLLVSVATDTFALDRRGEYFDNVRRFQILLRAADAGLRELTTAAREEWWRRHTLPGGLRYVALAGTMADMHRKDAPRTLLKSPYYARRSADYGGLRRSYYDLALRSRVELNDSQVTLPKAWFWPEYVARMHPDAPPFSARFLGVLGTHHWGLALPYVIESSGVPDANPFPRTRLLEALSLHLLELEAE